jgi:tRNA A-37 threonylcarbamoyl transferase component Bud32
MAARDPEAVRKVCQAPDGVELSQMLRSRMGTRGVVAFLVVDRTGLVVASENPASCGTRLHSALFRQRLDRALDGAPQFVRPHPDPELSIDNAGGHRRPVAWAIAPIRAGVGSASVALAVGAVADREFASVFFAARPGETTEAYAIADEGLMLTPTRFAAELVSAGLLPESGEPPSAFAILVRDPGGDVSAGHVPALEPAARPLTQAAALALAARGKSVDNERQGVIVQPYRSYHGDDVIGAWRWLPSYDIGVIAEISAAETFAVLRYLWISFTVIGAFVLLSLGAALTSGMSLSRLQRQFGKLQRLGAYTLERQLSEGGMATIYLARHAMLKRPTAVKILKKHVATDEFVHRFEREVQVASQLLHPNTVRIYDFGRTRDGLPYYVMEFLDGVTLAELVNHSGPVPAGRIIHILRQVSAALREAHEHGMIHRDVKPENVMLCRRGEDDVVKLLDFGLVKNLETEQTRDVTKQIKILGTPRYMAPERLLNPSDVDARSDIYALGAVGYYLVTGKPIFDGDDNLAVSNQVLHAPAPRASASGVAAIPEGLDALIAACLEKDRLRRPQTMDAVIDALDRLASRLAWTQNDAAVWWDQYRDRNAVKEQAAPATA